MIMVIAATSLISCNEDISPSHTCAEAASHQTDLCEEAIEEAAQNEGVDLDWYLDWYESSNEDGCEMSSESAQICWTDCVVNSDDCEQAEQCSLSDC